MKFVLRSALCASLICMATGCGSTSSDASDSGGSKTLVQPIVDTSEAAAEIKAAWRRFQHCQNASACTGYPFDPTSEVLMVPNSDDTAAYRRYEEAPGLKYTVVYSEMFGAVVLASDVFDTWLSLSSRTSATGENLFKYIGMPRPDGTFERGMITSDTHLVVSGDIYARYLELNDDFDFGPPEGDEISEAGGRSQKFKNGEIYWKAGLGAFGLREGDVLDRWKALGGAGGPLGFPVTKVYEIGEDPVAVDTGSGTSYIMPTGARFENGSVYDYPTTGAFAVTGDIGTAYENTYGGVTGFLGFPISEEQTVAATGDQFVDYQNGILVRHKDANGNWRVYPFSAFDLFFERLQGRDDDCYAGVCGGGEMQPTFTITTPERTFSKHFTEKDDNWNPRFEHSWTSADLDLKAPYSKWFLDVSVRVYEIDDGPNDDMGSVSAHYSIENLWGKDAELEHRNGDLSAWFTVRNHIEYGDKPFRQEQWWAYHNFTTDTLSYDTYEQTFADVAHAGSFEENPFVYFFYDWVYKGSAANGNCFGMTLEAVYATLGRSIYSQPIHSHLEETWDPATGDPLGNGGRPDPSIGTHQTMMDAINVRFGYQLGSKSVAWTLAAFLSGLTHEPARNFEESRTASELGEHPLISIARYTFKAGHSVLPYEWGDDAIKIADPNYPWSYHQGEDIIDITRYDFTSSYSYRDYGGNSGTYGRMWYMPFYLFSEKQYTPVGFGSEAIDDIKSFIVGSTGATRQISDDQGRTLFRKDLTAPPTRWDEIVEDENARVPNIAPIPLSDGSGEDGPQIFASKGQGATHHYDVELAPGASSGTEYNAMFSSGRMSSTFVVPGTAGKPERITAHDINDDDRAISLKVPSSSNSKKVKWTIAGAEKSRWAELSDLEIDPGQTLTIRLEKGGYQLVIENDGAPTTAHLRVHHGNGIKVVDVGTLQIPSGETQTAFDVPKTTLTLSNEVEGKHGWLVAPVTVNLATEEYTGKGLKLVQWSNDSQTTWTDYEGPFTYADEGLTSIWYYALDKDWNQEAPKSREVKIDTRVPVLQVSTGTGVYTRIKGFVADARAEDPVPGSGIDSFTVTVDGAAVAPGATVDIFWFALGTHTLAAHAVDVAGWETSKSATFEVAATLEDLPETIRELGRRGEITHDGTVKSLVQKAEAALASKQKGNIGAATNQLQALLNELNAQTGQKVSLRGANLLVGDVQYIIAHF